MLSLMHLLGMSSLLVNVSCVSPGMNMSGPALICRSFTSYHARLQCGAMHHRKAHLDGSAPCWRLPVRLHETLHEAAPPINSGHQAVRHLRLQQSRCMA